MQSLQHHPFRYLVFVLPALIGYLTFLVVPIATTFWYSFTDWNGANPVKNFIGLGNYVRLFSDPIFMKALVHNVIWILATIIIPVGIGLILAVLVSNAKVRGRTFFRVVYFIPAVLSTAVVGIMWNWIYNPSFGLLNTLLRGVGLEALTRGWLGDERTVLASLIATGSWAYFGFCMVICLAGLQSIDKSYYEAASIEGANGLQKFFTITIPLMRNVLTLLILNSLIGSFKVFDLVYVMTQGGPFNSSEVIATYMFKNAFSLNDVGYGSAVAVAMALIVAIVSISYVRFSERREA